MRKITTTLILITFLLSGCSVIPAMKPTMSSEEMATKVAVLLTAMPTEPGAMPVVPETDMGMMEVTVPPLPEEIGVLATPTEPGVPGLLTPTMDETAFAAFLGVTATPETVPVEPTQTEAADAAATLLVEATATSTATPPIAMPSATPTDTATPTFTPGPLPLTDAQLTATFAPSDPRTILPVPTWSDTMDNGKNWPLGPDKFTTIDFQNGFMMLTGLQKDNGWRLASTNADNAYIEATGKFGVTCHGMDKWGIMVRVPDRSTADQGYWFNITCDGKYAFQKWNANPKDNEKSVDNLIAWTSNSNIKPGGNALNRVGILLNNDHFTFYINGAQIGEWTDNSYRHGGFGLLIGARETDRLTLYVDEMHMWLNPPM